ncbi:MAG: HEAT repeat domain-containing protein [Phycisphaerae bacterium]|nr:HEAT repeat domain-containing protein [Phycisphaerae bacterium]
MGVERMERRSLVVILALVIASFGAADLVHAAAADRVTLKNNLLPGHFTQHRVVRTVHRKIRKDRKTEELIYRQSLDWTQLNANETSPGHVRVVHQIVDGPARVVSLFDGAAMVTPTPRPAYFGLSRGDIRLYSLERSAYESEVLVPKGGALDTAVLRVMLDFAYWPKHALTAGGKWERDVRDADFEGKQTMEFIELLKGKDETAAVMTMYVTGNFKGSLESECRFTKGQAIIHWARMDRTLLKLEARAEYERRRPEGVETYVMELAADATRVQTLTADQRDVLIDQLIVFDKAETSLRKGDRKEAFALCTEYRQKWPKSVWMPALEELERRISPRERAPALMKSSELARTLGEALIKYEAARSKRDVDVLDQTRRLLAALTKEYGSKIRTLAKSGDDKQRAPAVFALAFSAEGDDFYMVQKYARDESAAVRAMALAGMAARRDPETSVELLLLVLDDRKANVRARACEAVAACVPREHYSVEKISERLGVLMLEDDSRAVRLEAVRALSAIGGAVDVERLERVLSRETDSEIRKEAEVAVKRLRKRKG